MLTRENYTEQHIYDLWKETGADPSILERTVLHSACWKQSGV